MILTTCFLLVKTFFYLRIFKDLSFLVTMLKQVFFDLRVFMVFFFLILYMFAIVMSVLDIGRYEYSADPAIRAIVRSGSFSGQEYLKINKFFANIIMVYRISLGDYDFG